MKKMSAFMAISLIIMLASAAAADIGVGANLIGPLYSLSYHSYKTGLGIEVASSLGESQVKDMLSIFLSLFNVTDPVNLHLFSLALTQDFFKAGNGQFYFKGGALFASAIVTGKQTSYTFPVLGCGYEYRGIIIPNLAANFELVTPFCVGLGLKAYF